MAEEKGSGTRIERRARRLLLTRYLREATEPGAEEAVEDQLDDKVERIEAARGESARWLRPLLDRARELWARRSELSRQDVALLAAALLYVISPLDALPDLIPGLGYVDDVIVISWVLGRLFRSLEVSARARRVKDRVLDDAAERLVAKARVAVDDLIDDRADELIERLDQATERGVNRSVLTVAVGIWGATTVAAVSLAVRVVSGQTPEEWVAYVVASSAAVLLWNLAVAIDYWRAYRALEGEWRERLRHVVVSRLRTRHFVTIGLPVVILLAVATARLWLAR